MPYYTGDLKGTLISRTTYIRDCACKGTPKPQTPRGFKGFGLEDLVLRALTASGVQVQGLNLIGLRA